MNELPTDLLDLLNEEASSSGLAHLISNILGAFRVIGTNLRHGEYSHSHAGSQNAFGDHQLEIDLQTDEGKINITMTLKYKRISYLCMYILYL